jgi:outer membrane protein assembly factor BamB
MRQRVTVWIIIVVVGVLFRVPPLGNVLFASDWPQWRGPKRDGVSTETGLLKQWPKGGPPLAWKTNGLGSGFSSVSVADGRIFTLGDRADASYVIALSEKDGKHLWATKLGRPGGGGGYPGPRCTPTVDGKLAYALGQYGDLVCVDAEKGVEKWRKNLQDDFRGGMMSGWGYSESPLIDGDNLICTPGGSDGTLLALNKQSGQVIWRTKDLMDEAAYASVIVAEIGGVRQYIQLTGESVFGVGATDGQVLWRAARQGRTAVIPSPIVHEDHVYVTSGYGAGCNLFQVTANSGKFAAHQVYANKVMVNHHGGVVRIGEHLYGYSDGKGWVCQRTKTGDMVWSERGKLDKGAITAADGHLYLRSEGSKGTVVLIEATPSGFVEKGRFDQPERSRQQSWPHPVIANSMLYLRDQDLLLCYNIKQG